MSINLELKRYRKMIEDEKKILFEIRSTAHSKRTVDMVNKIRTARKNIAKYSKAIFDLIKNLKNGGEKNDW